MISLAWSAAQRCIAVAIISRARSSASSLYWVSTSLDLHGHLVGHIVTDVGDKVGLGLLHGEAGDLLQHFKLALLYKGDLLLLRFGSGDLAVERVVLLLDGIDLPVERLLLLLQTAFLLLQLGAARLLLPLILGRALCISSFASTRASLFLLSALFIDSFIIRLASSSALAISRSATFLR